MNLERSDFPAVSRDKDWQLYLSLFWDPKTPTGQDSGPGYGGQKWPPKCLGPNPLNLHHYVKEDFADVNKIRV